MNHTEKRRPRPLLLQQRVPKDCQRCGRSFIPEARAQRYCHDCGIVARNEWPRDHYAKNLKSFRDEAQRYRSKILAKRLAKQREQDSRRRLRVNRSELVRLGTGNLLESIYYGPEQKQVRLNCGAILDGGSSLRSLARHIDLCMKKPKSSRRKNCQAYRERRKIGLKY